jgi:hypothetical protein
LAATGIEEDEQVQDMNIYPNPSDGYFTLELGADIASRYETGEVFNALGEVILTFNVNKPVETVNLSSQVPGIYLLRLKAADGNVSETKRIMIR